VAGVILTPVWAWAFWIGAVVCVVTLMLVGEPLPALQNQGWSTASTSRWSIVQVGLLVSFATCGGVITYFITMLTGELKQRELELQAAEDERLRARQLEGLATLAAGAGHELATPLSTIAVVVKELSRTVEKHSLPASVGQDVALIRSELNHCRQILDRLASAAGDAAGERLTETTVAQFFHEVMLGVREPTRVSVSVAETAKSTVAVLPIQAVAQAIRNLVQNAIDASQPGADVQLVGDVAGDKWRILVIDRGDGMTSEVLQRIGQPFFTTKEPGRGMGLGLYLTQNVLNRLGGKLVYSSKPGHGTTAEVTLPCMRKQHGV
ncbi:MAG: HAMP domain-containing histidine kinase, partial [Pirellulaceae bacterium]|nr:HAMP domain-containing histidine kinase [Pirellulaceae bacterium]